MEISYPKHPTFVKPRFANLRPRYLLFWGFRNSLFNALPFALIWLASGINMLAAALAAFFMMLLYVLAENYRENRRLSEMARKVREQGNA